jgi:hypothetical protein
MKIKAYWCEQCYKFVRPNVIQIDRVNLFTYFRKEELSVEKKISRLEILN